MDTRIAASAAKGLTRFVGREKSMAASREAWNNAFAGSGQVLGVVGEARVGKSRLLLEFINSLHPGDFIFLEGRCLHHGGSMAYLPFLDILKLNFSDYAIQSSNSNRRRWALVSLSLMECRTAKEAVLHGLQDSERKVRVAARILNFAKSLWAESILLFEPDFIYR